MVKYLPGPRHTWEHECLTSRSCGSPLWKPPALSRIIKQPRPVRNSFWDWFDKFAFNNMLSNSKSLISRPPNVITLTTRDVGDTLIYKRCKWNRNTCAVDAISIRCGFGNVGSKGSRKTVWIKHVRVCLDLSRKTKIMTAGIKRGGRGW